MAKRSHKKSDKKKGFFERFSQAAVRATGSSTAFLLALLIVVVWAVSGPVFKFSETWQLVINTTTTIVTFLMVLLIQNTQNRDAKSLHLKLDELVWATKNSRNSLLEIEEESDEEIDRLKAEFKKLREAYVKHLQKTRKKDRPH